MELFEIEKFLFISDIVSTSSLNLRHTTTERINLKLLCTISSLYIYYPKYSNDNDELMNRFESLLLYKANHDDIIISKYDFKSYEVYYNIIDNMEYFSFQFRDKTEANMNLMKILILIDGWKIAKKNALIPEKEKTSNYIYTLIDSLIDNDFTLIINEAFFDTESKLLKEFTDYLKIMTKIKIEVILYEDEEHVKDKDKDINKEKDQHNSNSNAETYNSTICDRFNLELTDQNLHFVRNRGSTIASVPRQSSGNLIQIGSGLGQTMTSGSGTIVGDRIRVIPFTYLTHLCLSNTHINDKGFIKCINPILDRSPSLTHLLVDHNLLTINCMSKFKEVKCYGLVHIDFSHNKFTSNNLIQGIITLVNMFNFIECIRLKSNLIDNSFLIKFNPKKLNDLIDNIRNKIQLPQQKQKQDLLKHKISIDLRDNHFDIEFLLRKYFLWKPRNDPFKELILHNENIAPDIALFINKYTTLYKNIQLWFDHPYLRMSKPIPIPLPNQTASNIHKYFRVKCIQINKSNQPILSSPKEIKKSKKHIDKEIDIYKTLFQYLFLINFYFDPVMNSFSSSPSYFIPYVTNYINQYNHVSRFKSLCSYIDEWKRIKSETFTESQRLLILNNDKAYLNMISKSIKLKKNIQMYEIPPDQAEEMYMSYQYYFNNSTSSKSMISKYIKKVLQYENQQEEFNPNGYIDHLYYFIKFLFSSRFHQSKLIPLSSLNKLYNRVKIEIYNSLKDKDIIALGQLLSITKSLKLQYHHKIKRVYDLLKLEAEYIDQGLIKLINFQGRERYNQNKNPYFLFEINSFLDIFLKEALIINYKSDPVIIGYHMQFLRNNMLRNKFGHLYESLLIKGKMTNYVSNMNSDFDKMYDQYKGVIDYNTLGIPNEISNKMLSLHPTLIDYLLLCEVSKESLDKDYIVTTKALESNECYGLRNICNRIQFLLLNMSRDADDNDINSSPEMIIYNKSIKYKLHRTNQYMKMTRVLFRFFNELDMNRSCYLNTKPITIISMKKIKEQGNAIIIEAVNFKLSEKIQGYSVYEINKYKFAMLKYTYEVLASPLFDISNDKSIESKDIDNYSNIASEFNSALLKTMMNLNTIKSHSYFYKKVKDVIRLYLSYSHKYNLKTTSNTNTLWLLLQKEFVFLLIKFVNHDSMEFDSKSILRQYTLGIFYIMMFYISYSTESFRTLLKQWVLSLYIKNYYSFYCEGIFRAINNPYRYDYIPSSYEIRNRLDCNSMKITLQFYPDYSEEYPIDELTTGISLFNQVKALSPIISKIEEKGLYWIYYKNIKIKEYRAIEGTMFILELFGLLEQGIIDIMPNDEIRESFELKPHFVFLHYEFSIRRRIFSPMIANGLMNSFIAQEKLLLFNQIKDVFMISKRIVSIEKDILNKIAYLILVNAKINKECFKNDKGEIDYSKTVQDLFSNTASAIVMSLPIPEMTKAIEKELKSQDSLIEDFFHLVKNAPILNANLYHVYSVNQLKCIESGSAIIIYVDSFKIKLLNNLTYQVLYTIEYEDLVSLVIANDNIDSDTNTNNKDKDKGNHIIWITVNLFDEKTLEDKFECFGLSGDQYDVKDILKDILSYMQFNLAVKTKSELTDCFSVGKYIQSNIKEYQLVYHRSFNKDYDIMYKKTNDLNTKELEYIREIRDKNPQYQQEVIKCEKERQTEQEKIEQEQRRREAEIERRNKNKGKKSKFDINKYHDIPKYDQYALLGDDDEDDDSRSIQVKRIVIPKEEIIIKKESKHSDKNDDRVIRKKDSTSAIKFTGKDSAIQTALYFAVLKALKEFPDEGQHDGKEDEYEEDNNDNSKAIDKVFNSDTKNIGLEHQLSITNKPNDSLTESYKSNILQSILRFDSESNISSKGSQSNISKDFNNSNK